MKFELDLKDLPASGIINLVRQIKGLTNVQLCQMADVTPPTLKSLVEGGEVNLDTVYSLMKALGIQVTYAIDGEPAEYLGDPFDHGKILKKLRSLRGMSQNALAAEVNAQPLTITKLENGAGTRWVTWLAILTGVKVSLLLTYKYEKNEKT